LEVAVVYKSMPQCSVNSISYNLTDNQTNMTRNESSEYWADILRTNLLVAARLNDAHDHDTDIENAEHEHDAIDEAILTAPRRGGAQHDLACEVAALVYPDFPPNSLAPIIQYEKDIVKLRALAKEDRAAKTSAQHELLSWRKRIVNQQGPWNEVEDPFSLKGAPSLPMPVQISDPESLAPFFAHLRNAGNHRPSDKDNHGEPGAEPYYDIELLEFEKGVLYSDGRMDLCKMATGPRNIGDLMESLKPNDFSKHFLLGNNIIGPTGAEAIAAFIDDFPDRMETWYLAGNCIDAAGFARLVDSMVKSPVITNVWLKRNPLGAASAKDVFRLISQSPSLRTLDLDQTELGDEGVTMLFWLLSEHDQPIPLRHLYLNATGINERACKAISSYLALPSCALTSLYMSNNPIGSAATSLAPGLSSNQTLERISLQSCGLSDASTAALLSALEHHPNLKALDIGQSFATEDLGMRYNWLADRSAFVRFVQNAPALQYLNVAHMPMTQEAINTVLEAVATSTSMLSLENTARPLFRGDRSAVRAGQEGVRLAKQVRERLHANVHREFGVDYETFHSGEKRFLMSPRDVRFIDSVYRNRDAGKARRGLMRLEKVWAEGDGTLEMVAQT
jgi:Ran GTPase-activating protein (RanGAP) involved in mRNA processing and transport